MRKDAPLAVDVPTPDRDTPGWVKVGVIAAVGFVIGVAWPRVMGVKLGPSAPGEAAAAAASASAAAALASGRAGGRPPEPPPASVTKAAAVAAASAPAALTTPSPSASASSGAPQVSVQRGSVLSCKTTEGESKKGKECGGIVALDNLVAPHLRKLASCSAAEGQTGKLSFMATADFPSGRLSWDIGKSSTVGNLDGIHGCLKTHFSGVAATNVAHEHARYTVAYTATFAPGLEAAGPGKLDRNAPTKEDKAEAPERNAREDKAEKAELSPGGEAAVGWEVALVRDVPKTGAVVARLPRGTKVRAFAMKDGWYAIKYGDNFASDGFVYRGALGR